MITNTPKLTRQVFEARYDKGYRFLDRAGEVMLILEDLLPGQTEKVWMTDQILPTGAALKCPDLDIVVTFDAARLLVQQEPQNESAAFADIAGLILSTLTGRFDLRNFTRYGSRRFYTIATDSVDEAEDLSLRLAPFSKWVGPPSEVFASRSAEAVTVMENPETHEGFRLSIQPMAAFVAPERIDPRLNIPARKMPEGQKTALLQQLQRQKQREKEPLAGVTVDIDYYRDDPPSGEDAVNFLRKAHLQTDRIAQECSRPRHDND
jgi:hypothetical protein